MLEKTMDRLEIQEQYKEYIVKVSPAAMAIGRKVPYHLEYLRRYGSTVSVHAKEKAVQGKER